MCMGGSGPSGKISGQNRKLSAQQEAALQQLHAIFYGGTAPGYQQAGAFDPSQTYYKVDKGGQFQQYQPPGEFHRFKDRNFAFSGDFKSDQLDTALGGLPIMELFSGGPPTPQQQIKRGNLFLKSPEQTYQGFTPQFFQQAQRNYLNFAMPQLARQAQQTNNQLNFKLANQGLRGSLAGRQLGNAFQDELSQQRINIGNQGLAQSQDLQKQVNQQYNQLVNQLQVSNNPSSTIQSALQTASTFSQPSALQPVGNMFQNFANTYLGSQLYNNYQGGGNQFSRNVGGANSPQAPTARYI